MKSTVTVISYINLYSNTIASMSDAENKGSAAGWRPGKVIGKIRERQSERRALRKKGQETCETGNETLQEEIPVRPERIHDARVSNSLRNEQIKVAVQAGEGGSSAARQVGGWFPGKYAEKLFRRGAKRLLGLVNEENQQRHDKAITVGKLTLIFKGAKKLGKGGRRAGLEENQGGGGSGMLNPYFEVWCEGTKRLIKPRAFQDSSEGGVGVEGGDWTPVGLPYPDTDPAWQETALHFDVTDITTDVHILLLDKRPLRTLPVGRLILPLPNFLGCRHPLPPETSVFDLVATEMIECGQRPATYQALLSQKYAPQMKVASSTSSILPAINDGVVGQVVLEVALETSHDLFNTYLASRPLRADSFSSGSTSSSRVGAEEPAPASEIKAAAEEPTLQNVDIRQLAINVFRIKKALEAPPLLFHLLDHPIFFFPLVSYLVFAPLWTLPLHVCLLPFLNGIFTARNAVPSFLSTNSSSLPSSTSSPSIEYWPPGLVERVQEMESSSARTKLRRLRTAFRWLQDHLGLVASLLERCTFIFNWEDPHVTLPVTAGIAVGTSVLSLMLYFIPIEILIWCAVVLLYMKMRKKRLESSLEMVQTKGIHVHETKEKRERRATCDLRQAGDTPGVEEAPKLNCKALMGSSRRLLSTLTSNVLARTPDALEVLHRRIARGYMHKDPDFGPKIVSECCKKID